MCEASLSDGMEARSFMRLYSQLLRRGLYPLVLWHRGDLAELRYLRQFEKTQYLPPALLRDVQLRRLRALLDHAYRQCPFYRLRFERVGLLPGDVRRLEDLRALPVLEKADIQKHRDRMVAHGWPPADLIPNHTGGSTGRPLSFYLSRDRKCSRAAATLRHNRWAGWDIGDKTAVLWGAPRDVPAGGWRARLRQVLLDRQLYLDTGHITEEKLDAFDAALKRFRPRVILAYAGAAALFARFLESRGRTPYQPHAIVTSAEVLEDRERQRIENVFGCPVYNRYGCREVSVIASECPAHQGLHTMAEGLYVEIVDKDGRPAKPGELGSILVTDLLNQAMPLIRYRIGDLGVWEEGQCACGRTLPRLRSVSGRVTDFLVGSDGRLVSGVFLATYVIGRRPSLGQVQIHQEAAGQVFFRICRGPDLREDDLDYLQEASRRYLGQDTVVDWEFVESLPAEPSGKFLFCRSAAAPEWFNNARAKPCGEDVSPKRR